MALVSTLQLAFERELDAIVHDGSFGELEIVRHRVRAQRGETALSVTIDRPGGADLALCESVAARLNEKLGRYDERYSLVVESAGLERPLLRAGDYRRFAGERVKIVTSLTIEGAKTHRGVLRGMCNESVLLQTQARELAIPMATIKSAHLEFDSRADLQRDKRERKTYGNSKYGN
jgi:ribosome maturation factor RimP